MQFLSALILGACLTVVSAAVTPQATDAVNATGTVNATSPGNSTVAPDMNPLSYDYFDTCSGCYMQQTTLYCNCMNLNKQTRATNLDLNYCFGNDDGKLNSGDTFFGQTLCSGDNNGRQSLPSIDQAGIMCAYIKTVSGRCRRSCISLDDFLGNDNGRLYCDK